MPALTSVDNKTENQVSFEIPLPGQMRYRVWVPYIEQTCIVPVMPQQHALQQCRAQLQQIPFSPEN